MRQSLIEETLKFSSQFDSKEISLDKARKILGSKANGLNDEEIQVVINMVMTMAEIAINDFFNKKVPEVEKKLYNLTANQSRMEKNKKNSL